MVPGTSYIKSVISYDNAPPFGVGELNDFLTFPWVCGFFGDFGEAKFSMVRTKVV